ncbi:LuxR family transcriptional regulator [Novosphingobium resinovorum]|uniref:LuxR family transcriptional regulator n=1 Tax=Novosphingobium resinovorum TaxID=158500 RepID=UPI002ED6C1A2|nr:LuxR family transcriptional regulator [Novosphingobium resinovorum]
MDSAGGLQHLLRDTAAELGCRYFAVIRHDMLNGLVPDDIPLVHYPGAVLERLFRDRGYRRDPVLRGCIFADSAFLWSEVGRIIDLDRHDHAQFEFGAREGLNEGITVPCFRLGQSLGSCTFAGMRRPEDATDILGVVQMMGVFAVQAARRLSCLDLPVVAPRPRLHPRPRDCVVLAGRGYSNKEIARALSLTPRTVDGYLTEARRLFDAHDRTELVVSAVLAGEIGLHELKSRQPG